METLVVRRLIRATPEQLFEAWTDPLQLMKWWGPKGIECSAAEVDLRVGGAYRLGNKFPDGRVVWIHGTFTVVERPRVLVYTWAIDDAAHAETVTVRFEQLDGVTEVAVFHERIVDVAARDQHATGWEGCLDKLDEFVARVPSSG